ncbi:bacillithiol biosynthesis cysteine-adding enzyme BshC [Algoriphagus mannitolivorans]|uniref:bacillithiol biosynthesis cysteine-adding enzyme BshC n=1 Tax=Algoriphagus mannitolivorans TaxID=226504 RepID=UPI000429B6A6|nr:bacillithiol biosynthesis cysteine-adding enzyme BshC [Algoriphagus mannitolivorans]
MEKHCVELRKTGQFSGFFLDYLEGKDSLKPFYTHLPKLESFPSAIAAKKFDSQKREILSQSLYRQYSEMSLQDAVAENVEALKSGNTFTVVTGHQLNLFTGPLYFIYKIVSTINLAKKLKSAFPEFRFVPVYWMASEDHDFDEINYFRFDGKKYQWNSSQTGAVGDFELDESFRAFMKEVSFAPEVFKEAYLSSKTLGEAVRKYVDGLFGAEGLVVLDGNDADLKFLFKEVIAEDLFSHSPFQKAIEATEQLENLGYKSQIFPREINFFYLDNGVRERIEQVNGRFQVLNTELSFSEQEMKELVDNHPERFSPNVVLRPLYQEMILPNLAYLGGPAEVVYWLQLKGVFDNFKVPFPVLLPRNFALILDTLTQKKMEQLGWGVEEVFQDFETWKKSFVQAHASVDFELGKEKEIIETLFAEKGKEASQLEKSLLQAFEAGKVRSLKILDQMSAKLRKAEERKQAVDLERARRILEFASPNGTPQERTVNMMQFYLSNPDLISQLLGCFDPLEFEMIVLKHK